MHSGELVGLDDSNLTEQEKEKLRLVMERAKAFDQATAEALAVPPQGMLMKWTNAFKGWQSRWFCIDQQQGTLQYYISEDKKSQSPRGSLTLWGALVSPVEEDSQTFTVSGSNGEVFKLRAADSKGRQHWVARVRYQVELCNNKHAQGSQTPSTAPPESLLTPSTAHTPSTTPTKALRQRLSTIGSRRKPPPSKAKEEVDLGFPGGDAMREAFSRLQSYQHNVEIQLDSYAAQSGLNPLDKDVLLLRASSKSAVSSVKDCLTLLKASYKDPDQLSTYSGDVEALRRNSLTNSPARNSLSALESHRSLSSKSITSNS